MKTKSICIGMMPLLCGLIAGPVSAEELATLKSYWHDTRIDYFGTATEMGQNAALNVFGYSYVRDECRLYSSQQPETVSLDLYWSEDLQDNATVATEASRQEAITAGYEKKATEGYVYTEQKPGTVPLKLYYNADLEDYYTTTPGAGESAAQETGYEFVRIEGYVLPAADPGESP